MRFTIEIPIHFVKEAIQDRSRYTNPTLLNPTGTPERYSVILWPRESKATFPLREIKHWYAKEDVQKMTKTQLLEILETEIELPSVQSEEIEIIHG